MLGEASVNSEPFDKDVQAMAPQYEAIAAAIEVDADGRVTAGSADAVLAIGTASVKKPLAPENTNCKSCNTAKGCGPLNAVKNCATTLRT
jgi:hypothetical protein